MNDKSDEDLRSFKNFVSLDSTTYFRYKRNIFSTLYYEYTRRRRCFTTFNMTTGLTGYYLGKPPKKPSTSCPISLACVSKAKWPVL